MLITYCFENLQVTSLGLFLPGTLVHSINQFITKTKN
jgi:hypothetical protein